MDFLAVLLFASVGFAAGVAGAIFIAQARIRQADARAESAIREQRRASEHLQKREADMEASRGAWSKAIAECDSLRQKLEEAAEKNRQLEAHLTALLARQAEAKEAPVPEPAEPESAAVAEPVAASEPEPEPAPVAAPAPVEPEALPEPEVLLIAAPAAATHVEPELALQPAAIEPEVEPIAATEAAMHAESELAVQPAIIGPEVLLIAAPAAATHVEPELAVQPAAIEPEVQTTAAAVSAGAEPLIQPEAELIVEPEASPEPEPEPLAAMPVRNGHEQGNPKICSFCGSIRTVELAHLNGNGDQDPVNLIWSCRACKTRLDALLKRVNFTRRSRPLRPGGARNWREWSQAVTSVTAENPREEVKNAIEIIRATPVEKRMEYIASHLRRRRPATPVTIDVSADGSTVASPG